MAKAVTVRASSKNEALPDSLSPRCFCAFERPAPGAGSPGGALGFDGRAVPERFNILSLLISNPGPAAFDGALVLQATGSMGKGAGAPIVQPVYLTPGSSRFVQFHPFVESEGEWQVRWGRGGKDSYTIDAPKLAGPARVLLSEPDSPILGEVRIKIFPDDLFPTSVCATDGLDAVVLDHVPRWEITRREAFLDWVRQGGVVHLLKGAKGDFPEFTAELAALNGTEEKIRLGSGFVFRHAVSRSEVTGKFLDDHGFAAARSEAGRKRFDL